MSEPLPFSGALALTDVLIGRGDALAAIWDAVQPRAGSAFRCLLLSAAGGKGKTRLLHEVYWRLNAPSSPLEPPADHRPSWASDQVICLPLIDVADPHLHGIVAFLRTVREGFRNNTRFADRQLFTEFDKAIVDYETTRDGGFSFEEVQRVAEKVVEVFEQDYRLLAQSVRPVWVIDTMEQLYLVPPEIEDLLGGAPIRTTKTRSTYDWLRRFIEKRPANTTLLLAGRPAPTRWLEELRTVEGLSPVLLEVEDFTQDETLAYLVALRDQLAKDPAYQSASNYLSDLIADEEQAALLYELTSGNPIRLALYIDLLVNGDSPPEPFRHGVSDVRAMGALERERLVGDIDRVLLMYLSEMLGNPVSQALEYLAVMRRGLDLERLIHIWGGDRQKARDALDYLLRLSFVKSRPDGTLLLHDEAYTIYQQQFVREPEAQRRIERERERQLFEMLVTFCRERAKQLTQAILYEQPNIADTPVGTMEAGYLSLKERLQEYRRERRRMYAEQVHYSLYLNPPSGFAHDYFELAELAFAASDPELDALLQSEVELFFFGARPDLNQQQAGVSDDDWKLLRFAVVHDRLSRWIKRLTQLNDLIGAQHLAANACLHHETLIDERYDWARETRATTDGRLSSELFVQEWQACGDFAAIFTGEQIDAPIEQLNTIITNFETTLTEDRQHINTLGPTRRALRQRLLNVLAQCLLYAGYGYATLNDFKHALDRYRRADAILKRTQFNSLHAEVKNDMSRVLSEIGESNAALAMCQEALDMRSQLGFDYLIGLSRNTMALIYLKNVRPTQARYYVETALSLFRQLNNPRGIGLALRQLAEAKRRLWGLTANEARDDILGPKTLGGKMNLLTEAAAHIQEAERIFREVYRSLARLMEVQIEAGCIYRDWASFLGQVPGDQYFDRAVAYLDAAIRASKESYPQHYTTALVNKAWLYGHSKLHEESMHAAQEALETVPPQYLFNVEHPLDLETTQNVVYFRELSKLHALYATELIPDNLPENLPESLKHYIFAVTYMQLFSQHDTWYLGKNKQALTAKLARLLDQRQQVEQIIEEIIARHHLRELEPHTGPLQVVQVMREVLTAQPDLAFID